MRAFILAATLLIGSPAWAQQAPPPADGEKLHARALAMEMQGNLKEALTAYIQGARAGSASSARRLSQAYEKGELGVTRDYAEAQKWASAARNLDAKREGGWGCPPKCPK